MLRLPPSKVTVQMQDLYDNVDRGTINPLSSGARPTSLLSDPSDLLVHTVAECASARSLDSRWEVRPSADDLSPWIEVRHADAVIPAEGWKLHVSASPPCADGVLRQVLGVLLAERVVFKVAASLQVLDNLNHAVYGLPQIGKFITIYPSDDQQAVRLARALDQATRKPGFRGPAIPSDRPLNRGSLVFYRYGASASRLIRTSLGQIVSAMTGPHGDLIPDHRRVVYQPPDGVTDPFLAAGLADFLPEASLLLGERFLVTLVLHRSPRGSV